MLTVDPARRATIEDVLAHPWTAAAFTSSTYGYAAGSYHYKYMRRLVGHLRQADNKSGSGSGSSGNNREGSGSPWWHQMHGAILDRFTRTVLMTVRWLIWVVFYVVADVPPPPARSSASMAGAADGTPQDAAAEARLADMLGCAPPNSARRSTETTTGPHDGNYCSLMLPYHTIDPDGPLLSPLTVETHLVCVICVSRVSRRCRCRCVAVLTLLLF